MSGTGPLADVDESIYLQTANGQLDAQNNRWGDSLLKLGFTGTQIKSEDLFDPCDASFLDAPGEDLDLGSAAPLLLPDKLILRGGKTGAVYLMARNNLGKFQSGAPLHTINPTPRKDRLGNTIPYRAVFECMSRHVQPGLYSHSEGRSHQAGKAEGLPVGSPAI